MFFLQKLLMTSLKTDPIANFLVVWKFYGLHKNEKGLKNGC